MKYWKQAPGYFQFFVKIRVKLKDNQKAAKNAFNQPWKALKDPMS